MSRSRTKWGTYYKTVRHDGVSFFGKDYGDPFNWKKAVGYGVYMDDGRTLQRLLMMGQDRGCNGFHLYGYRPAYMALRFGLSRQRGLNARDASNRHGARAAATLARLPLLIEFEGTPSYSIPQGRGKPVKWAFREVDHVVRVVPAEEWVDLMVANGENKREIFDLSFSVRNPAHKVLQMALQEAGTENSFPYRGYRR